MVGTVGEEYGVDASEGSELKPIRRGEIFRGLASGMIKSFDGDEKVRSECFDLYMPLKIYK